MAAWQSRFCLLSTQALEEGEAILRLLEGADEGRLAKKKPRSAGAFADWTEAELARRREGGLKHAEDPSGNPLCPRGHALFHRHHPWVSSQATTQCTICLDGTLPLARIRFHCASKLCGGTQVCAHCAERYGSETTTALLIAERLQDEGDVQCLPALACAVAAMRLRTLDDSLLVTREMLRAALLATAPEHVAQADRVMRFHDEALNTEAYRTEGRLQSARLARVVQELQQRHRALERTLRALDKRSAPAAAKPRVAAKRARAGSASSSSDSSSDEN